MTPTFTNRFNIYASPEIVQIVFKNILSDDPSEHSVSHVVMARSDAVQLQKLLEELLSAPV